ncbi:hypothetical protein I8H83_02630 [Candidatus Saccharibacteria bacterium]|nr:hypothetical protein [Candidatus Saccharibacteria bacterium]
MSKNTNPIEKFVIRYSIVILVVAAAIVLSVSVYLSYNAYLSASTPSDNSAASQIPTTFDKETSDRIDQLHTSDDESVSIPQPTGRISPFSE